MDTPSLVDSQKLRRRCTAKAKSTGERCRRRPHPGTNVCIIHGAGAPQVQKAARQRLDELVLPAIATLHDALASGNISEAMRAARLVLDRAGYGPTKGVVVEDVTPRPEARWEYFCTDEEIEIVAGIIEAAKAREMAKRTGQPTLETP